MKKVGSSVYKVRMEFNHLLNILNAVAGGPAVKIKKAEGKTIA